MSELSELLGPGTWVQQGPATLIVREAGWVVLVPGTRKEIIEAAWTVLGQRPTGEELLDRLVATAELESADKLPAILFGIEEGSSVTYGVKGKTPIAVYTPEGSQLVAGTDDEPFVLATFEEVRRTAFGELPGEESLGAPRVESGITRVRGFVHMLADPAQLDDPARQALAEQVENDGRSIEDPAAKARRAAKPASTTPKPAPTPSAAPAAKPAVAGRRPGEMPPSLSGGRASSSAAATPAGDAGPSVFDGLFADQKPALVAEPAPSAAAEPTPSSEPAPPPASAPAPPPESSPAPGPARTGGPAQEPAAGRRRLVSTSLFHRTRQPPAPQPAEPPAETQAPTVPPAPAHQESAAHQESDAAPAPPPPAQAPGPGRSADHPVEPVGTDRPTAPEHSSSASVPTPEPPDEDEASQVTLIAPIDHGEGPEEEALPESSGPIAVPVPRHGSAPPVGPDLDAAGSYDDLFGKTIFRRIEDAAVRRSAEDEEPHEEPSASAPPESEGSDQQPRERATESASSVPSTPLSSDDASGRTGPDAAAPAGPVSSTDASASIGAEFIDWVPGVGRAAPEIAHTAARRATEAPSPDPVHPRAHLPQRPPAPQPRPSPGGAGEGPPAVPTGTGTTAPPSDRPVMGGGQPTGGVVALPGLVCVNGHANSPERSQCRTCQAPLLGETRTVARPPLGTVDISTGASFVLDRTAIIGRRPRASRVSGNDVPQLITVPSPQQDISRSHLELRLEGWHVVALDMGTTNGTTLFRPGTEAMRLRTREGVVLYDGDQLDLGDGVRIRLREAV